MPPSRGGDGKWLPASVDSPGDVCDAVEGRPDAGLVARPEPDDSREKPRHGVDGFGETMITETPVTLP
jgi:hypothetical protein